MALQLHFRFISRIAFPKVYKNYYTATQNQNISNHITLYRVMSSESSPAKKARMMKKIGTHNGSFHCDEVLACYLLKRLPQYHDAEIVRTRDPSKLDDCDIVVDVGGVFDPSKNRFDHHQKTFQETMSSLDSSKKWVTKLSSAGLIYFHFGLEIIADILEIKMSDPVAQIVYDKIYENFVEEIDGIDNGVNQFDGEPRYQISTTISNRVRHLNPAWNESDADEEKQFHKAMHMVGEEFLDRVSFYKNNWMPARELVEEAIRQRHEVDKSGEVIVFKQGGCPWRDHLLKIEEDEGINPNIKYVLYTDNNNKWRVQCVPLRLGAFENRLSLPAEWRGLRDDELSEKSGIPGCIFVHASGFIGGNNTYEGVLKMAQISLQQRNDSENGS